MFRICACLHALALTTLLASGASAASVKIDQITAVPYSEFTTLHATDGPTGAVEKYVPGAGQTLWLVTFRMTPEWDEATKEMNFDSETFGLYDGEKKVEHVGGMQQFGVMEEYFGPGYLYRRDDWKETKPEPQWKRFWVSVPNGKTELVLRLTQVQYDENNREAPPKMTPYTATVKLAGTPKPFDYNDFIEVKVRAVKMVDSIDDKSDYDDDAKPRKIINEGGSIMQLTVQLTPKLQNDLEERHFDWAPSWVGLSFGRGGRAVCTGTRRYGRIYAGSGETIEQTDGDIWESKTVALYFPVPSNLKTFDVTFLGQKVTTGAVP